jgi:hypothetical protein
LQHAEATESKPEIDLWTVLNRLQGAVIAVSIRSSHQT